MIRMLNRLQLVLRYGLGIGLRLGLVLRFRVGGSIISGDLNTF